MTPDQIHGSCLCGAVRFSFSLPYIRFNYCHCESCRKTTGSSNAANVLIPPAQFRWEEGESLVSRFTDSTVNLGFRRWFCSRCGGPVPRLNRTDELMVIPAGLLDSPISIRPERSIYWNEHADWLVDVDAIPKFIEGLGSDLSDEHLHAQSIRKPDGTTQTGVQIVRSTESKPRNSFGVAFDLLAAGPDSMMTKMRYRADNVIPFHSHPNEQIGYLLSGRIRVRTRDSQHELTTGDTYVIPANVEHSIEIMEAAEEIQVFTPLRKDFLHER